MGTTDGIGAAGGCLICLPPRSAAVSVTPAALESASGWVVRVAGDVETALTALDALLDAGRYPEAVLAWDDAEDDQALQLFEGARRRCPAVPRVLVARPERLAERAAALNDGLIGRLLLEPCAPRQLRSVIEELAVQRRQEQERAALERRLAEAERRLACARDELDRRVKEKAEELIRAIYYDELTGLASRALVLDRLEQAMAYARRHGRKVALLCIGLDRFKDVNDSLGAEVGDAVLVELVGRIGRCVRSSDTLGRIAGDQFALLISDVEGGDHPDAVARRVLDAIARPLRVGDAELVITASAGIAFYPDDGAEAREVLAHAETAMRQAKGGRGNAVRHYSGKYRHAVGRRLSLEAELRRAVERQEFELYFQPRIDTALGRVVGAEALLRWRHPERGLVPPLEFLPVLEDTGLIEPVGEWALDAACRALVRWQDGPLPPLQLAVNLSARQFRNKRLPRRIAELAEQAGLDPAGGRLEVEITEGVLMEDVNVTRNLLGRLHEMGVRVAIDDFGTGYSALSYLLTFPLDYLKIDKSFVDRVVDSDDAKAIVEAIVSLSYSLKLVTIAEGVETRAQLEALQALGCKQFQGYLFAKPLPETDFVAAVGAGGGAALATLAPVDRLLSQAPHR
ncbi:MAG: hypothetical protein KatS3mg121_0546 [Gammaproteobacteria bacterium]|nr:MAG: hypothetical protein KatS3mg121_0546 [Gammaproteobacteria bacterium]